MIFASYLGNPLAGCGCLGAKAAPQIPTSPTPAVAARARVRARTRLFSPYRIMTTGCTPYARNPADPYAPIVESRIAALVARAKLA